MTLALGVDGGGTSTRCIVADGSGRLIGAGVGGACKPDAVEPATARANLQRAILAACEACGGPQAVDTAFLGIGGVVSEADQGVVRKMLDGVGFRAGIPVGIDHDIRIALAGGTAGQPGIALIVGTGSSCYGRNSAGESWRSGGWGFLIDDMGSGYYLGQQALAAIVRAYDGRGPDTALKSPILEALDVHDMNAIMHLIYFPAPNYAGIASLAPLVTRAAEQGDTVAREIIARGCQELALMVATTARKLHLPADALVIPVGSLATSSAIFRQTLDRAILQALPEARIRAPIAPPVAGAAFLALEQVGITLTAEALAACNVSFEIAAG